MSLTPLARFANVTYALFRIVTGFLFAFHGAQKIFGAFGGNAVPLASMRRIDLPEPIGKWMSS